MKANSPLRVITPTALSVLAWLLPNPTGMIAAELADRIDCGAAWGEAP